MLTTYIIYQYHSPHHEFVKRVCILNVFLFLKAIKKFIDLNSKTKYTSPKTLAQQQKLPIAKLKRIKSNQQILPKTNNPAL